MLLYSLSEALRDAEVRLVRDSARTLGCRYAIATQDVQDRGPHRSLIYVGALRDKAIAKCALHHTFRRGGERIGVGECRDGAEEVRRIHERIAPLAVPIDKW